MATRKTVETSGRLWVEESPTRGGPVARVAIIGPVERVYSYAIPDGLAGRLDVGARVEVPVGRRDRAAVGYCVEIGTEAWTGTLKSIAAIVDEQSILTEELVTLGVWMSRHYACPLGKTLAAMAPEDVRRRVGFRNRRYVSLVEGADPGEARLGEKQRAVLATLAEAEDPVEQEALLERSGAKAGTVQSLSKRGLVAIEDRKEAGAAPDFDLPRDEPAFALNAAQSAALERTKEVMDAGAFRVLLLFGVSGSGKTEVYIHAMRHALAQGRQVIFLVPEIALTTQLTRRLASRFSDIAVIHSGLTGAQRSLTWASIREGRKRVIVGTRSALFAPCPDLGMIVIDEEQEPSFKNLAAPRFHVRDTAIKRAQGLGIPVLMGSATPSLESWHNCERFEHYERLRLPDRVSRRTLPEVTIADMNEEYSETSGTPLLSRRLLAGLEGALSRGRQSILLINRRGFASWVQCPRCRHTVKCPSCNAAMVFHSAKGVVLCHYCGRREQAPEICPNPSCGGKLARMGGGTERVVERIEKLFPKARIARADSDILRKPEAYQALIEGFEARSFDVLVGTQMIAKGLDFPEVGFVGVVGADVAGGGTDFRTGERLFQLVTQVAGRAGRGERPGRVVLQTSTPESGAIQFGARHDFEAFAKQELASRFAARLPPYSRLTRCVFSDGSEQQALAAVREWVSRAEGVISELGVSGADVLGPAPCNRPRIRNRYRFEALLRYMRASEGHAILARVGANRRRRIALESVVIDVDPVDLF